MKHLSKCHKERKAPDKEHFKSFLFAGLKVTPYLCTQIKTSLFKRHIGRAPFNKG